MSVIIGVDLSLTGTGVAVWRPDEALECHTIDGTRLRGQPRIATIVTGITNACRSGTGPLVVIEDYAYGAQGRAVLDLAELRGVLRHTLWRMQVPIMTISTTGLKKYATGRGSTGKDKTTGEVIRADKEGVMLAVERRYGHLVSIRDNNQADALVLLAMAMHHYGSPLAPVPAVNAEALRGSAKEPIRWPDYKLELM